MDVHARGGAREAEDQTSVKTKPCRPATSFTQLQGITIGARKALFSVTSRAPRPITTTAAPASPPPPPATFLTSAKNRGARKKECRKRWHGRPRRHAERPNEVPLNVAIAVNSGSRVQYSNRVTRGE
ncbi:hypothetical protein NDU88_006569 [Pleurodeles waltl]|uniref:Uncharacterized protein n=1 Tax=Pleurodeles waltl TaxID=8319 RepID=A0AAV7RMV6_PLEWA|nr:hypothetical protein NDU88_006569 [Pleurodeles waltl]